MTMLVGITGYKRSGKGETARFLTEDCTTGVVYQIGFADKVKQFAARSLGFKGSPQELIAMMDEAKLARQGGGWVLAADKPSMGQFQVLSGRRYLQNVGTEARKMFGDDFWVNQVLPQPVRAHVPAAADVINRNSLKRMYPDIDIVTITDLRFVNEAERVLSLGGVIWQVVRPGTESDGHASEQELPARLVTRQIDNNGTLDDLRHEVESAIEATLN